MTTKAIAGGREMSKFRKKPVVIEAICWDGTNDHEVSAFGVPHVERKKPYEDPRLKVRTLGGDMLASPSDWIIKGVKGELYPCKPDIFEATYEPVEDAK